MKRWILPILVLLAAVGILGPTVYRWISWDEPLQDPDPPPAVETVRITFPEGITVEGVLDRLAANGVADRDALEAAAADADLGYDLPYGETGDPRRLEGLLFPDTYDFYVPEDPVRALRRLLGRFDAKRQEWDLSGAGERGYGLREIVTIASLIERETDGTDRGKISSVIWNRLTGEGDRGGTYGYLQIDASVLYALPGHTGPLTRSDLETDDPYNTYRYPGLPPGPIACPGEASILAALSPEDTGYYYYALGADGRHQFFETYAAFQTFLRSSRGG